MGIYHSVQAVAGATGDGPIDWSAVADAAKGATDTGDLTVETPERDATPPTFGTPEIASGRSANSPSTCPKPSRSRTATTGSTPTSPRSAA